MQGFRVVAKIRNCSSFPGKKYMLLLETLQTYTFLSFLFSFLNFSQHKIIIHAICLTCEKTSLFLLLTFFFNLTFASFGLKVVYHCLARVKQIEKVDRTTPKDMKQKVKLNIIFLNCSVYFL